MLRLVLFEFILLVPCAYALWRGGGPERVASITFLVAATLTEIVCRPHATRFVQIETGITTVDTAVLIVMLALALFSERFWPIWMAAMAGIIVLTHVSMLFGLSLKAWAYWRSQALWSYPMQLLLALATWRHHARLRRTGADPSWRRFFAR
ncbi:MAG: hypothetical protein JOY99_11385 [Sphingomonadaceae bacterium]|nr:hypothetical protein [Sphingomonadaceae bacterium]